jgi:hypothetical protein
MAKLKTREIVILVFATLAILYVGYEYLIAGPARQQAETGIKPAKVENFVSGVVGDISKEKLTEFDQYVINRVPKDLGKSPFLSRDIYRVWVVREGSAVGGEAAKIIYSGYVDSGRGRIAVLNGLEYRVGETLEIEGYVLKQVTPSKVLILNKNTGNSLEIPLQE